jgi:putative redox protein
MKLELQTATSLVLIGLDEPTLTVDGDAEGEGFGPLQMLVASLVLCTAAVLKTYANNVLRLEVAGLRLSAEWAYAERPKRVGEIQLEIVWPGLPESRIEAVRRAAETCTVHRTLERPPDVTTRVRSKAT